MACWPSDRVGFLMAGFESDVTAGSSRGVDIAQWGALRNRTKLPGPRLLRAAAPVIAPESGTLQSNNQRQARGHWYFTPLPPPCIPSLLVRRRRGRRENKKKGEKKEKGSTGGINPGKRQRPPNKHHGLHLASDHLFRAGPARSCVSFSPMITRHDRTD